MLSLLLHFSLLLRAGRF